MHYLKMKKLKQQTKIRLRGLELGGSQVTSMPAEFDVCKNICLVPPFDERDVDKYFILFESGAFTLKWPKHVWTLLLQCVLSGKAQIEILLFSTK